MDQAKQDRLHVDLRQVGYSAIITFKGTPNPATGIGAVLFHRFSDGSERPICNVSKTLTDTQRNYSQIQ